MSSSSRVSIVNSKFVRNQASYAPTGYLTGYLDTGMGGVLMGYQGQYLITVDNSTFLSNEAGAFGQYGGGLMSVYGTWGQVSDLTIRGCLVENQTAGSYPVLYFSAYGRVSLVDSIFRRSLPSQPELYYEQRGSYPYSEMCMVRNDGGGFLSSLNVTRCAFANSSSAFHSQNQHHIEIADSSFTSLQKGEDSAHTYGGAFYLYNVDSLLVRGSVFRHNSAYYQGGAWSLTYVTDVLIVDSEFEANVQGDRDSDSGNGGGAMYLDYPETYVARRCTFANNIAYAGLGGAVKLTFMDSALVKFEECSLIHNEEYVYYDMSYSAAAVFVDSQYNWEANIELEVANSTFLGNTGQGGTLGVYGGNVSARVVDSTFQDNVGYSDSSEFGAGIFFYTQYGSFLSKSTLYRNQSGSYGAAIIFPHSQFAGYVDLRSSTFVHNR